MKISPALFVFYLITLTGLSQTRELRDQPIDQVVYLINAKNPRYSNAVGSPYLNETFLPAKINGSNQTKFVRFNIVDNRIEVMIDTTKFLILSNLRSYKINFLEGSDKEYQTLDYKDDEGNANTSFFELVHEGENYNLYLKERIKYTVPVKNKNQHQEDRPAKFLKVNNKFYFSNFMSKSTDLIEIPRKKKHFLQLFKERSQPVEEFIKKENLGMDKNDLIKILDFYFNKD